MDDQTCGGQSHGQSDAGRRGAVAGAVRLSIVIPMLNEEEAAGALLEEVRSVVQKLGAGCEVIVVDDGSRDRTGLLLDELAARWDALRVLHHRSPRGQSAALARGFAEARGELIATLDGDGQSDPADIPGLLGALEDYDLVTGIRARRHDSFVRRASSRIAYRVRNAVLHDGIIDTGCSTRVFRRACLGFIPLQFRGAHRFLPALFRMSGCRIKQLPVNHRPRRGGRAKYGIANRALPGLVDLLAVRWMQSRYAPPERPDDR